MFCKLLFLKTNDHIPSIRNTSSLGEARRGYLLYFYYRTFITIK